MLRYGKKYRPRYQPALGEKKKWVIVSYPKSGRTWLRQMLRELDCDPVITHLKADDRFAIPYSQLPGDLRRYRGWRVALLVRHPLDTLVSGYHQAVHRFQVFDGSLEKFLYDPRFGLAKWILWHHKMLASQLAPQSFTIVHYESLQENAPAGLQRLLDFWGIQAPDERLAQAAEAHEFKKMQSRELEAKKEQMGEVKGSALTKIQNQLKSRRGKVGGFRDEISPDVLEDLRGVNRNMGMPFGYDW